jgi:hypothetical protein
MIFATAAINQKMTLVIENQLADVAKINVWLGLYCMKFAEAAKIDPSFLT